MNEYKAATKPDYINWHSVRQSYDYNMTIHYFILYKYSFINISNPANIISLIKYISFKRLTEMSVI